MLMNPVEFEKTYQRYLNKMLESDKLDMFRRKLIMRCLYPNQSTETLEDMLKGIIWRKQKIKKNTKDLWRVLGNRRNRRMH